MKSFTTINSQQSHRIAKRLLNHWKHKFDVTETSTQLQIFMPTATVSLQPQTDTLQVEIIFQSDEVDQTKLEQVVLEHLSRMGNETLDAVWQRVSC
ncbi:MULTISPECIES: DUF2218 domain-containing protein [unclassified Acinetobacter]|uniref:DUF2218 domain-containing protein n=1 Tax=unclassified Acinetobacter TaxID=196816 RepID=UPI002934420A|nr:MULTISPECIES: DUF2218 domain-containing protein [unclassified Acinetobacter]WOE31336.1 DUF2218 domain-containing protein [Acinetobacter sp. SAAs470]WOE39532.1 DUF2218 domain-containing protein [Acinetobacter sp. SAAs474]